MLLNPQINENNYQEFFKLDSHSSFLTWFINLHKLTRHWRAYRAYQWNIKHIGVEATNQIPNYTEAKDKLKHHGLKTEPLFFKQAHPATDYIESFKRPIIRDKYFIFRYIYRKLLKKTYLLYFYCGSLYSKLFKKMYHLPYPIVGGYSDIVIVNSATIKEFAHYCGVFAATELFVELAIPTALALSADTITTEEDLTLKGNVLWKSERAKKFNQEFELYDNSLNNLLTNFPSDTLYIHPIKLSRWK